MGRVEDDARMMTWARRFIEAQQAFLDSPFAEGSAEDDSLAHRASAAEAQLLAALLRGWAEYEYGIDGAWGVVREALDEAVTGVWAVEESGESWALKDAGRDQEPAGV